MSHLPITAAEARALFAPWRTAATLVVAVSGGPDSVALLWLLMRWRRRLKDGPALVAATVDHGLRADSAKEASAVKMLAASLGVPHVTRRWTGPKPNTGVPAAARMARYDLLTAIARKHDATHIVTAHTQDDQAETVLMRLVRGSGLVGLKAMTAETARGDITIVRPLLSVPKARLIATLARARIAYADDPTNRDAAYLRPRLRELWPALVSSGLTAGSLSRFAARMQRADAALAQMTESASRSVTLPDAAGFDAALFAMLPDEIRLRLLQQAIATAGCGKQADLGQIEALIEALATAPRAGKNGLRLRRSLAGTVVTLTATRLLVATARLRQMKTTEPQS